MPIEELSSIVAICSTKVEAMKRLGFKTIYGGQGDLLIKVCLERGIPINHFLNKKKAISYNAKIAGDIVINNWLENKESFNPLMSGWQLSLKTPIRRWILNRAGNKCEECGWNKVNIYTGKIPIQIHHIDGDASNNRPDNLKVLCPSCHSLTKNFGRRSKSKRIYRYALNPEKALDTIGIREMAGAIPA